MKAGKLRATTVNVADALRRPLMAHGDSADRLLGEAELLGYSHFAHSICCQLANLFVAVFKAIESLLDERQREVRGLFLHNEKWIDAIDDLLHLNHVADPPNPDVAVVDAILVQRAMLAPNPTSANARINHVDHSTVGVANRDTDLLPTFPLRMGHPDGAFAIDDACKPAEPLIVSHCRKWMNRSERRPDSFHVNQNTRRNLLANYKTRRLFCGGGLGAVGWHGRAWEYQS